MCHAQHLLLRKLGSVTNQVCPRLKIFLLPHAAEVVCGGPPCSGTAMLFVLIVMIWSMQGKAPVL